MTINAEKVLVDDSASGLKIEARADVSATAWPLQQGKYVVFQGTPNSNEAWVINTMICFAWARTNVQNPPSTTEGVERIQSKNGDGFFLFQPYVGNKLAWGRSISRLAAWTTAAGATAADIQTPSGYTHISDGPFDVNAISADNQILKFLVPPGQPLTVLFSLLKDAIANPLPVRYSIGGTGPLSNQALLRVDYAGVIMTGSKLTKAHYDDMMHEHKETARVAKGKAKR